MTQFTLSHLSVFLCRLDKSVC